MSKVPFRTSRMLAPLAGGPFTKSNWVFDDKYDGVRILAYREGLAVSVISRDGIDRTVVSAEGQWLRVNRKLCEIQPTEETRLPTREELYGGGG